MFPPNTTEQNFTIYAVSDAMIETQEEFTLNVTMLKYGSWYMIMTGAMSHLLVEDATVSVGVSSPQYSVLEGGMMAVMVEVLSGNVTEAFEVNVTSVNGTAGRHTLGYGLFLFNNYILFVSFSFISAPHFCTSVSVSVYIFSLSFSLSPSLYLSLFLPTFYSLYL